MVKKWKIAIVLSSTKGTSKILGSIQARAKYDKDIFNWYISVSGEVQVNPIDCQCNN